MTIREGVWDCPSCGTKAILGRKRDCPGCNTPRPEGTAFYLPQEAQAVTDFTQLSHAEAGADWYCLHCSSGNNASATACSQCGATKGSNPTHEVKTYAQDDIPHSAKDAKPKPQTPPPPQRSTLSKLLSPKVIGGITLSTGAAYYALTPSHEKVTVENFAWEQTITVEALQTVKENDWQLPKGAVVLSQQQAVHHYDDVVERYITKQKQVCANVVAGYHSETHNVCEQVQTGTTEYQCGSQDLGNGYFKDKMCSRPVYTNKCHNEKSQVPDYRRECHNESYQDPVYKKEPRYQTQYTYNIEKWVVARTPSASNTDHNPQWPAINLAKNEREAKREASYTLTLKDSDGKTYTYTSPDPKVWQELKQGQKVTVTVDNGKVLAVKP